VAAQSFVVVVLPDARDLPDNSFPKSNRLLNARDFGNVFRNGRKIVTETLVFHVLHTDRDRCRLGLAVSRKVGKAVRRNRVKRRIRELFRTRNHEFPRTVDLVAYPRKTQRPQEFDDYQKSFDTLLSILERRHRNKPRK